MGKESVDVPLLSTENVSYDYGKKTSFIKSSVKWVLKLTMWVIFIAWAALMFFYPSQFMKNLFEKWMAATGGSLFGITGSLLLAFSAPLFIIALLSVIYLIISGDEEDQQKKTSKRPSFKLWTFPVFVDGPFGVVSAAEFIGILLFVIFVVWAVYAYTLRNLDMISQFHLSSFYRRYFEVAVSGFTVHGNYIAFLLSLDRSNHCDRGGASCMSVDIVWCVIKLGFKACSKPLYVDPIFIRMK